MAKPTFILSIPLLLDIVVKIITEKVEEQGRIKRFIFNSAIKYKTERKRNSFINDLMNELIFKQVQEEVGGQLKYIGVGAAPLSAETQKAIRAMFDVSLLVGYGTTETSACTTCMEMDDTGTGHTGGPNVGVFLRLMNWEEGGYRITDKPNPRGEVIVGGPVVSKGYFKLPEEDSEAFFCQYDHTWFRTGDIGEIDRLGRLKIIDRKKDLIKLKNGKFISLSRIESRFKTLASVENMCAFADSDRDQVVAVIIPSYDGLWKAAGYWGIDKSSCITIEELCRDESVKQVFLQELQSHIMK